MNKSSKVFADAVGRAIEASAEQYPERLREVLPMLLDSPHLYHTDEFFALSMSNFGSWLAFRDDAGVLVEEIKAEHFAEHNDPRDMAFDAEGKLNE